MSDTNQRKDASLAPHLIVIVAAICAFVFYQVFKELNELKAAAAETVKVAVIDIQSITQRRLDKGEDPASVVRYTHLLAQLARSQGYLLLDKSQVLSTPSDYEVKELSLEDIERQLKANNEDILGLDHFQNLVERSKEKDQRFIDSLLSK